MWFIFSAAVPKVYNTVIVNKTTTFICFRHDSVGSAAELWYAVTKILLVWNC